MFISSEVLLLYTIAFGLIFCLKIIVAQAYNELDQKKNKTTVSPYAAKYVQIMTYYSCMYLIVNGRVLHLEI